MIRKNRRWNLQMIGVILALAWPTMLEQAMQTAVQYIDTAMVGALGTAATAAVGSTTTVNWLVNSSIAALGVGFLSFIARSLGAGDRDRAARISAQAVLTTLVVGAVFTVLCTGLSGMVPVWMQVDAAIRPTASLYFLILYAPMLPRAATTIFGMVLRSAGDTKSPMKIGILVNLVNILLNFLLIYPSRWVTVLGRPIYLPGADLGVAGAALASAVAFTLGGIAITIVLWRHPVVSPKGRSIRPDMQILKPCMQVSLPNMLQRFGTSLGYVAFASMINALGEVATAAHTIANTVESAFYIPGYGMQTAAATLAGNAYGAKDEKKLKDVASMFIPIEVGLMILSGVALFFTATPLVSLFSDNPQVISLGSTVLKMVALSEPFFGVSIIEEGLLQGVGKTRLPFVYNIIGMWGVRIVGTFIMTRLLHHGLVAAWGCMIAHNILLFALFLYCHIRQYWNPLKTAVKA